jgi:hypothetical protein
MCASALVLGVVAGCSSAGDGTAESVGATSEAVIIATGTCVRYGSNNNPTTVADIESGFYPRYYGTWTDPSGSLAAFEGAAGRCPNNNCQNVGYIVDQGSSGSASYYAYDATNNLAWAQNLVNGYNGDYSNSSNNTQVSAALFYCTYESGDCMKGTCVNGPAYIIAFDPCHGTSCM